MSYLKVYLVGLALFIVGAVIELGNRAPFPNKLAVGILLLGIAVFCAAVLLELRGGK